MFAAQCCVFYIVIFCIYSFCSVITKIKKTRGKFFYKKIYICVYTNNFLNYCIDVLFGDQNIGKKILSKNVYMNSLQLFINIFDI